MFCKQQFLEIYIEDLLSYDVSKKCVEYYDSYQRVSNILELSTVILLLVYIKAN